MFFSRIVALHLVGITLCAGILRITKEPKSVIYFELGSNADFDWDYEKSDGIKSISWLVFIKPKNEILRVELTDGTNVAAPNIPPAAYVGRLQRRGSASLTVKNITYEDSTDFTFQLNANPGFQPQLSKVRLVVTGPCTVYPGLPEIQSAKVGDSVTFTCNSTGIPSEIFTWTRGVQGAEKIVNGSRHSIGSVTGSSQLTIKDIDVADTGSYVCDATVNINQPCSARGHLQVLYGPKQDSTSCPTSSFTLATDGNLTICCPVSGYPPPIVTWEKDGSQLQSGESTVFIITSAEEKDFGNYSCTASNGKLSIGPFFISVRNESGELKFTSTHTDGKAGEPAILKWKYQGVADYFVLEIRRQGHEELFDVNVGRKTYVEFYYHTFRMMDDGGNPEDIEICVDVLALKNKKVVDVFQKCLTIKKPSDTKDA